MADALTDSDAAAAQLPRRIARNASASCPASIPESGPTSMLMRRTRLEPWLRAIVVTCVSKAWQTDNSCISGKILAPDLAAVCTAAHGGFPAVMRRLTRMTSPVLILGFGNTLLGDDGAGVRLVERLRSALDPDTTRCIDGGTISFSLLPYVEAAEALVIVDAADLDEAPGTVRLFEGIDMDRFMASERRRTVHEVGVIDLLDMARLRDALPSRRALLCIQPARIEWNEALSADVAAALPVACREAHQLLRRWGSA
jgi:hydrogenase maturation protease